MIIFPIHANETIWKPRLYVANVKAKITWKLPYVLEWSSAHLSNFNNLCALSNLVSLFIKFDVRSKRAFTSFFFNVHETCTINEKCICYGLQHWNYGMMWMNVMILSLYLILKSFLMQFRWNLFNFLAFRWNFHFRNVIIMPHVRFMIMFQRHTNEM